MTYREATRIAYQERGVPEKLIDKIFAEADQQLPLAGATVTYRHVPEGQERAFIEAAKKLQFLSEDELKELHQAALESVARNERNN